MERESARVPFEISDELLQVDRSPSGLQARTALEEVDTRLQAHPVAGAREGLLYIESAIIITDGCMVKDSPARPSAQWVIPVQPV